MSQKAPSVRTRIKRGHNRAHYDAETVHAILDATPVCNVGYVVDGTPYVTPTCHWREGNRVYWHGSSASRMLKQSEGREVCLTVFILDGMVMARSGFHHSVNYRSVAILGKPKKVMEPAQKEAHLKTFIDGLFPGRWDMLRKLNSQELKATTVLSMPIDEASAKVRPGMPIDDDEDYDLPIWAGVIPVRTEILPFEADPRNHADASVPDHVVNFALDANGPAQS